MWHRQRQGRPLGLLVNWLMAGRAHNVDTRTVHVHEVDPCAVADRQAARDFLFTLRRGEASAREYERALRGGESLEAEPPHIK